MGGTIALLAVFFLLRGRVRIEKGWAGFTLARFSGIERFTHWLLAVSFIVLALTGLTARYGGMLLAPLLGTQGFADVVRISKMLHGMLAFAFMAGLLLAFVLWVRHSLPHWRDVVWVLKGGGIIVPGWRPAAWKLNAGQKILFWLTMIGGVLLSLSGVALFFPGTGLFARTLAALGALGLPLPAVLTPDQEMHYAALWHAAVALALLWVVCAHIIIRTVGIQGAFAAMGSGRVDANWARQHHSLWAERELKRMDEAAEREAGKARAVPAE
jgi:formate dehydrogenase subunit gamma